MKKALMIMAAVSMGMAQAQNTGGRSAGSASTALNFKMEVVAGCAVNLLGSYTSAEGAKYNGTDATPETVSVNTKTGDNYNFQCQTGTNVKISATSLYGQGATFEVTSQTSGDRTAPTTFDGRMSLAREGFTLVAGSTTNNDDKTLEGDYRLAFQPGNIPARNGDYYSIMATFKPKAGQFEPQVGKYTGTINVTVSY